MIFEYRQLNSFIFTRAHAARFYYMRFIFFTIFVYSAFMAAAQLPGPGGRRNPLQNIPGAGNFLGGNQMGGRGFGSGSGGPFKDSLLHRTGFEDSATIMFRYLDTARFSFFDSSVNDFSKRWLVPWTNVALGNSGSATRSLLFSPNMKPGWDHGFHAYDAYTIQTNDVRFFNTTRPYTQLVYVLGSKAEQNIRVLHTQNIRYNWNFSFQYNLLNAPGIFRNQRNAHNNLLFNTWYVSPKRRYGVFFIATSSKTGANENGGLRDVADLEKPQQFGDRSALLTNFGDSTFQGNTFLSNEVKTGNIYRRSEILLRQYYDFGKKDSVVTDSNVVYLYYPRLRLQHTVKLNRYSFEFIDNANFLTKPRVYEKFYQFPDVPEKFGIKDYWQIFDNEFAVYSFPELKNSQQFLKLAAGFQSLKSDFGVQEPTYSNLYVNGEYRNKTKNRKWDMELAGTFFTAGFNFGDYNVQASLKRVIGKKFGALMLGFQNVSRTPSFVHNDLSNFKKFNIGNTDFKNENTTIISAAYELPQLRLVLGAKYFLAGNYVYFKNYYQSAQEATLFNVLQLYLQKQVKIRRYWNLYTELYVQQSTPNAPVNLPLAFTRNRLAYEGRFFKNLNLSTGLELRYHTPYKADGYSPVLGQFFLQQNTTISNLPDIAVFLHFRIRSMYIFVRGENLNTFQVNPSGFFNNNLVTPLDPTPGLLLRVGIFWGFVN
jgi:hypothetical protein